MKNNIFCIIMLHLVLLPLIRSEGQSFHLGIRGGLNLAQWKQEITLTSNQTGVVNTSLTTDSRIGFLAGIYGSISLTENFGLQPELFYNSIGAKSGSSEVIANYITMPVFLKYNVGKGIHFIGGPHVGYLLSAKGLSNSPTGQVVTDTKDYFNKIDFGLTGGIGLDMNKVNFGIRYTFGLSNIVRNPTVNHQGFTYNIEMQNVGWQIVAGYKLK